MRHLILVFVLACGGVEAAQPAIGSNPSSALTVAGRLPGHSWLVTINGCTGALRIVTGMPEQSLWGCASTDRAASPWPMFAGFAKLSADGQSVVLGDNDLNSDQGYPVPRNAGKIAPDGTMTGTFSDPNHFSGTITGWGAPISITLELADRT